MNTTELNEQGFAVSDGIIRVYNIDPQSGEYINYSDEFLMIGVGIPAHSYLDAPPPAKPSYAVCRHKSGWGYLADHRGKTIYRKSNGEPVTLQTLGEIPFDFTPIAPPTEFEVWQADRWVTDTETAKKSAIAQATSQLNQELAEAKQQVELLSDAVEFNLAQPDTAEKLLGWRKYRVLLSQVNLNTAPEIIWPAKPE